MNRSIRHAASALTIFSFFLFSSQCLFAQDEDGPPPGKPDTLSFDLMAVAGRVPHSLYNSVELVDERPDKGNVGLLYDNSYYGVQLCLKSPLEDELKQLIRQLTDSTAGKASLLVQMKRFLIYNDRRGDHVLLRFRLFEGWEGVYRELAFVDTAVRVGVTIFNKRQHKFIAAVNGALSAILSEMLTRDADTTGDLYSRAVVPFVDGIKKSKLPLYGQDAFPDGVYLNYASFSRLQPDYTRFLVVDTTDIEHSPLQAVRPGVSTVQTLPEEVYAFVLRGKAYISHAGGWRLMMKKDGDFFITSKLRVASSEADLSVDMASFALSFASMFRLPMVQVWGLTAKKKFVFEMDYRTGELIPIRPLAGSP